MNIDWYPLINSLRIAAISCVIVFFTGVFFAYYAARLPRTVKGILDVILTLPMVLPPTVCGYFLLLIFGTKRPIGIFLMQLGIKFVMTWYGGILAAAVVAFPLMYRTARGAFESFDCTLSQSGQTLGLSNTYIFWRIRMPACRQGILAGTVLAFARPRRIRCYQYAHRLHPRQNRHDIHDRISALAHKRRCGRILLGHDKPRHKHRRAAHGQSP